MTTIDKIIYLLNLKNIEQQKLAMHLGLQKAIVSDWKKGKSHSYMKYIPEIAAFFEVPVDTFYTDNNDLLEKYATGQIQHSISNKKSKVFSGITAPICPDKTAMELLNAYNELSLKDKARALSYIIELKEKSQA